MRTINMLSAADSVKGQGVGSAYEEQVALVQEGLQGKYEVYINEKKRCDIQHFHTINLEYLIPMKLEQQKCANVGYVHFLPETVEDSLDLPKHIKQLFYKYMIAFYDAMDYLVTVNPYFIEELGKYGIDKKKVTYIPNYVSDMRFYKLAEEDRQEIREQWEISEDAFVVLGVGQVQTRKGVLDFIETAKRLPELQFVWAGGFSFGPMTEGYKVLKKAMEEAPKNVLFTGIVDRDSMNGIYNMANMLFLPSFHELFPMTVLEAMSVGKPVLLRDLDIYPNILFDFYEKESSLEGFCQKIRTLYENREQYETAVKKAEQGHQYYSAEHVLEMWEAFYDKAYETCLEKRENGKKERTFDEIQKYREKIWGELERLEEFKAEQKERFSRLFGLKK